MTANESLGKMAVRFTDAPKAAAMQREVAQHGGISWCAASAVCTALEEGAGLRTFDKGQRKALEAWRKPSNA